MRRVAFAFDAPVLKQLHIRRPAPKRNTQREWTGEYGWILDLRLVFERVFCRQPKSLDNSCGPASPGIVPFIPPPPNCTDRPFHVEGSAT